MTPFDLIVWCLAAGAGTVFVSFGIATAIVVVRAARRS